MYSRSYCTSRTLPCTRVHVYSWSYSSGRYGVVVVQLGCALTYVIMEWLHKQSLISYYCFFSIGSLYSYIGYMLGLMSLWIWPNCSVLWSSVWEVYVPTSTKRKAITVTANINWPISVQCIPCAQLVLFIEALWTLLSNVISPLTMTVHTDVADTLGLYVGCRYRALHSGIGV